jgi:hypothetical protein
MPSGELPPLGHGVEKPHSSGQSPQQIIRELIESLKGGGHNALPQAMELLPRLEQLHSKMVAHRHSRPDNHIAGDMLEMRGWQMMKRHSKKNGKAHEPHSGRGMNDE